MDVKSDNLVCNEQGLITLLPSQYIYASAESEDNCEVVGTPYWMAPELIRGLGGGYKTCVWSMGIVLYELLFGDPPYMEFPPLRGLFLLTTKGIPMDKFEKLSKEYDEAAEFFKACTTKK